MTCASKVLRVHRGLLSSMVSLTLPRKSLTAAILVMTWSGGMKNGRRQTIFPMFFTCTKFTDQRIGSSTVQRLLRIRVLLNPLLFIHVLGSSNYRTRSHFLR